MDLVAFYDIVIIFNIHLNFLLTKPTSKLN